MAEFPSSWMSRTDARWSLSKMILTSLTVEMIVPCPFYRPCSHKIHGQGRGRNLQKYVKEGPNPSPQKDVLILNVQWLTYRWLFHNNFERLPVGYLFSTYRRKTCSEWKNIGCGGVGRGSLNPSPFGFRGRGTWFLRSHEGSETDDKER